MYYENFRSLLVDLDNDFELMNEIMKDLDLLIEETKVNVDTGLKANDSDIIGRAVHKLKGALLNFRAIEEVNLLDSMEAQCKSNIINSVDSNLKIIYKSLIKLSFDYKIYYKDNHPT
ncbi:MAG: Hpt domain-containing protein [Acidaminobacteraceae bacterium]